MRGSRRQRWSTSSRAPSPGARLHPGGAQCRALRQELPRRRNGQDPSRLLAIQYQPGADHGAYRRTYFEQCSGRGATARRTSMPSPRPWPTAGSGRSCTTVSSTVTRIPRTSPIWGKVASRCSTSARPASSAARTSTKGCRLFLHVMGSDIPGIKRSLRRLGVEWSPSADEAVTQAIEEGFSRYFGMSLTECGHDLAAAPGVRHRLFAASSTSQPVPAAGQGSAHDGGGRQAVVSRTSRSSRWPVTTRTS